MLGKIFDLSKEAKRSLIISGLSMSVFNLMTMLPALLFTMVTNEMLEICFGNKSGKIPLTIYLIVALVLLILIYAAYRFTYRKKYYSSGKEDLRLRMELADKIRKLPLSYIGKRDLSDLTTVIMDDVTVAANSVIIVATDLIGAFISGIMAIIILAFYNLKLSLCLAACLPVVVIVMGLSRRISEGTNIKNKKKKLAISDGLQEYLENIKVLRSAQKTDKYQESIAKKIKRVLPGLICYELLAGLSISISYNIMRIGLGIVIIVGSTMLISGEISVFTFLLFLYVAVRIYEPLTSACEMLGEFISTLVSIDRIKDLLAEKEQDGDENLKPEGFDIEFDDVTFGYENEDVIKGVSFTAKQGEITALVGPSGCGKSTLSKLAARFWDVDKGAVKVGGIDVKKIAPENLLQNYSIVFQDVVLFNDTIYNNIKIGKENATKEEVLAAAKLARCDEFIDRLPQGMETVIGENGKTLSGGERQRLSIARAFLKDAPIILLDESTASIDPENETKIQEAIGKLIQNKTVLIIAHKLRSIVDCDKIVVLKEGKLEEEGTHYELMEKKGLYHKLYSIQNESVNWAVNAK